MQCPLCRSSAVRPFGGACAREYFECAGCRLVHLAPWQRLPPQAERRHYELHENNPEDPAYRAFLDRLAVPLARHLRPGAKGLDFGSGPGPTLSLMLEERGFELAIYDPLFAPDARALERSYEFVTCSEAAEHFFTPEKEFSLLDRLLQPGGWLGVMTGMRPEPRAFPGWHYALDPTHVSFYSPATMRWIAAFFGWAAMFPQRNVVLFHKPRAT
jgi:SAM-dependent methyltransferase